METRYLLPAMVRAHLQVLSGIEAPIPFRYCGGFLP
jgi:hypothetical protein